MPADCPTFSYEHWSCSAAQALFFVVLAAHDEDLASPWQPYPAAVQPGQLPCTEPRVVPKDKEIPGLQDSAVGRGAFSVPAFATAVACIDSLVAGLSLADLHLSSPIARQTYHAICAVHLAHCIPSARIRFANPEKLLCFWPCLAFAQGQKQLSSTLANSLSWLLRLSL